MRRFVDNGPMVVTGMEDGLNWANDGVFPARPERATYAHRLIELRTYRQGFAVGLFLAWLTSRSRPLSDRPPERHPGLEAVGGLLRLRDPCSGETVLFGTRGSARTVVRVLSAIAGELERHPATRVDIVVHPDHVEVALADQIHIALVPQHDCVRWAAQVLRRCLGSTASGLRLCA